MRSLVYGVGRRIRYSGGVRPMRSLVYAIRHILLIPPLLRALRTFGKPIFSKLSVQPAKQFANTKGL